MTHATIGFIGAGQMGLPMAHALLDAGYGLRAYNRSGDKIEPLVRRGAHRATPEAVAEPGGLVLSMLADDAAVHAVAGERLVKALGSGGVHIGSSTLAPSATASLARMHAEHGATYLGSPVFGRPDAARLGYKDIVPPGRVPRMRTRPCPCSICCASASRRRSRKAAARPTRPCSRASRRRPPGLAGSAAPLTTAPVRQ